MKTDWDQTRYWLTRNPFGEMCQLRNPLFMHLTPILPIEPIEDVGLDGLNNAKKAAIYTNHASQPDPAADDYTYYLNTTGGVVESI